MPDRLPIEDCLPQLIAAVDSARPVILRAPPGAGKTTGVPPALLHDANLPPGKILLLQPRRLAARAAAGRLSHLAKTPIGATYGYHVRFDRKVSRQTRVVAMTTGVLLRQMTADPLLEDVGCVILDEFHERSLEMDLVLGMLERIRNTLRDDLRLLVMSATLETKPVQALISDAVTIESQGQAFDVDIRYQDSLRRETPSPDSIAEQVVRRLPDACHHTDGDVLVFLPGVGEIHRVADLARKVATQASLKICKLYGDLTPADQDAVLAPSAQRKLVLATNVAETSITIPGITCVIDTGLARTLRYDTSVGIPSLELTPISKASADQRAGRAGRTAPGVCFRLWPPAMQRSRPDHTPPEVARADLSSAILNLAAWGERDIFDFPWVTPPAAHAVQSATELLVMLAAIDDSLHVTEIGRRMNELPLHPRLSRLLLAAKRHDCIRQASLAAALLSERDPFERSSDPTGAHDATESDLISRVLRLERHIAGMTDPAIHRAGAKNIDRVARSLCRAIDANVGNRGDKDDWVDGEAMTRSLLAAFPDRLAKRRAAGSMSARMVGGRGVKLDRSSSVRTSELFLCLSVDGNREEALVRIASGVQEAWLPEEQLVVKRETFFHPSLKSVVARDRRYFFDLLISQSPAECRSDDITAALLLENARENLNQILSTTDKALLSFLARWRFLTASVDPDRLPIDADAAIDSVLDELCRTRTSFKALAEAPWLDHLKARFSYEQLSWFDQQAPEAITVPSGNQIRLEYPPGKPPVLAVRIQEIFGWSSTPRLAGGSVPVQLHLLGPNHRPQQITDDLESFWQTTYTEVRKELKRRYAKHHWPDNPWAAVATRNGLKPKR